jgi:hypothetical protein
MDCPSSIIIKQELKVIIRQELKVIIRQELKGRNSNNNQARN